MSIYTKISFPATRMRRLRRTKNIRALVSETTLSPSDLIYPVFLLEGKSRKEEVESMPGVSRKSIDLLLEELKTISELSIPAIAIFPVVEKNKKSLNGEECFNPNGLVQNAIKAIKTEYPDLIIISDVALDPYTTHGHDGIIDSNNSVVNDVTVEMLVNQAISHAEAGADIIAPSDMMDGRIGSIRSALEKNHHFDTMIMSYAAKYASSYYGPFRDAVGSSKNLTGDKSSYQMDPANSKEALKEVALDLKEGADLILIKPALPYLDIIEKVSTNFQTPTLGYQVSGEYAMLKAAANNGWLNEKNTVLEALQSIKRAGACAVLSYYAIEVAEWLN